MGARAALCPTCGRSWTGRDVRFCGVCGDRLGISSPHPTGRPSRRVVAGALTASLLIAVTAGLAVAVSQDRGTPFADDPRVEFGDGPIDATGEPLSEQEAEALLQRVDPSRLRCEPRGCEIWRRDRQHLSGVAAFGDLVIVLDGVRLSALDAETGAERWNAPVGHLRSVTSDGEQIRATSGRAEIAANQSDDGVYLVTGNEVSLVGPDGNRVWSEQPDPGVQWSPIVLDRFLILHGQQHGGNVHRLAALEPATGHTAWTVNATSVLVVEPDVIVVTTPGRQLRAIDPATGHTMWERRPQFGLWAESAGPWLVHHHGHGIALLDRTSGEQLSTLPGYITEPVIELDDVWLVVIASTTDGWSIQHPAPLVLLALSDDGETVWELRLEPDQAWGCCSLVVADDQRHVSVTGGTSTLDIDAATGTIVAEHPTDDDGTTSVWQGHDGTTLRWRAPGELTITDDEGTADILGDEVWVESLDPLVIGSEDHLLGVRLLPR